MTRAVPGYKTAMGTFSLIFVRVTFCFFYVFKYICIFIVTIKLYQVYQVFILNFSNFSSHKVIACHPLELRKLLILNFFSQRFCMQTNQVSCHGETIFPLIYPCNNVFLELGHLALLSHSLHLCSWAMIEFCQCAASNLEQASRPHQTRGWLQNY